MTSPAARPTPVALAEGWRIEIPMPIGRNGKPVGWANLNDSGHWAGRYRVAKAWRTAAYKAYERHRLPKGLGHVYIEIEYRFADRRVRDPDNFAGTTKPVIDALQPTTTKVVKGKLQTALGWGVIPGDDPRYVTRGPELPVGEPLGHANKIKGLVIITIKPVPQQEVSST